jgi:nicotinamide riboside kinase
MKIALSGSAGTGKTTLVNGLSKFFTIDIIKEEVRKYLENHNITDIRAQTPRQTMDMQWWVLREKIKRENALEDFFADRSTADNLAYTLRWCAQDIDAAEIKEYARIAKEHAKTYDAIVICPWGKLPLEDDGVRSPNEYYQYEIHCLILGILNDWQTPYRILKTNALIERINEMVRVMCCGEEEGDK